MRKNNREIKDRKVLGYPRKNNGKTGFHQHLQELRGERRRATRDTNCYRPYEKLSNRSKLPHYIIGASVAPIKLDSKWYQVPKTTWYKTNNGYGWDDPRDGTIRFIDFDVIVDTESYKEGKE